MTYARPFASMVCNTRDIATAKQQVISNIGNPIVEVIVAQGDERQECLLCMLCHTDPKFWFNLVGGDPNYLFVPCNRLLFCAELVCDA